LEINRTKFCEFVPISNIFDLICIHFKQTSKTTRYYHWIL